VLAFMSLDQRRLDHFMASARVSGDEIRVGMTQWLTMRVLQYVIDNDELRSLCVAAGVFRLRYEPSNTFRGETGRSPDPAAHVAPPRTH